MGELAWGRRYLMVRPDHFRVDYAINPFMDPAVQPDPELARSQWDGLVAALRAAGAVVEVLAQRADAPDMVYAMNLGLALRRPEGDVVALSHMRFPERRVETAAASRWFDAAGFSPLSLGSAGVGPHFEAGDAFPFAGRLVVGYGLRTEELALKHLAGALDVEVLGVRIVHPAMYHLDLGFCPLDGTAAMVCPAAFDDAGASALLDLIPDPIVLSEEEALTFCANSVVIGTTVVMPCCPGRVRLELDRRGFEVALVDVSELHKGGGSVRCLTNPLDISIGPDLARRAGGAVRLSWQAQPAATDR